MTHARPAAPRRRATAMPAAVLLASVQALTGTAAAQFQPDTSRSSRSYLPVDQPLWGVAVGDVDGDLDVDVLGASTAAVLLRAGPTGWVPEPLAAPPASQPRTAALRDVDGDGDLDALLLPRDGSSPCELALLENVAGTFAPAPLPAALAAPVRGAALADVDGDGDLDLVASAPSPLLFVNTGGTVFVADPAAMPPGLQAHAFPVAGDFDGDGDADVCCSSISGAATLLANDGTGRFTDVTATLNAARIGYVHAAAGDFDGDGFDDAALVWFTGEVDVFWGGPGAMTPQPGVAAGCLRTAPQDLDGDGRTDLASFTPGGCDALYYRGLRQWSRAQLVADSDPVGGGCGDVDGDGSGDVLLCYATPHVRLVLGGPVPVEWAEPAPWLAPPLGAGRRVYQPLAGDVDGDGRTDLLFPTLLGTEIHRAAGGGRYVATLAAAPSFTTADGDRALADLDGDGDLDFATSGNGVLATFTNDGAGTFAPHWSEPYSTGDRSQILLGDVDGDGDPDLLHTRPIHLVLYSNDGAGAFPVSTTLLTGSVTTGSHAILFDVDGDGDLDIAVNAPNVYGNMTILVNDGTGAFRGSLQPYAPLELNAGPLGATDLDGDGDQDLLVQYGIGQGVRQYRNDGAGVFTEVAMPSLPFSISRELLLGDFDRDGDADALLPRSSSVLPLLLVNDGSGGFLSLAASRWRVPLGSGNELTSWSLADVDDDGDPDVLAGTVTGQVLVAVNHTRQVASAGAPRPGGAWQIDTFTGPGHGAPGLAATFASLAPAPVPVAVPGLEGVLGLDAGAAAVLAVTPMSPLGITRTIVPVPALPGLVGVRLFVQGLVLPANGVAPGFSNTAHDIVLP